MKYKRKENYFHICVYNFSCPLLMINKKLTTMATTYPLTGLFIIGYMWDFHFLLSKRTGSYYIHTYFHSYKQKNM